jgi:hypothetical protein
MNYDVMTTATLLYKTALNWLNLTEASFLPEKIV